MKTADYRWDFATGLMAWDEQAASALGVADVGQLSRANAFALLVDAAHASARFDAVTAAGEARPNATIPYRTSYRLLPQGRRGRLALIVEETGICWFGANAKPAQARGTLLVLEDEREIEQRKLRPHGHDEPHLDRTGLTQELAAFVGSPSRLACKGAFLLVVIDNLREINETQGFDIGDEAISLVGRRLGRTLRVNDRIGRFASNVFGILLDRCPPEGIEPSARRMAATVRDHDLDTSAGPLAARLSIGAVALPGLAATADQVIAAAKQALDSARDNGSGALVVFEGPRGRAGAAARDKPGN